jgi:hypothetical protein
MDRTVYDSDIDECGGAVMISEALYIPPLCEINCRLPEGVPVAVEAALTAEWARLGLAERVRGKQIALGIGSRGVANIAQMARCLVGLIREGGGQPFIVPAMGSHGGATPEGQIEVLAGLGVTAESAGCPIRATMETVVMGYTARGMPAHLDKHVAEADGLILINRVKPHTDYHGPHESGLLKMTAIGLGKERGAAMIHSQGVTGLREHMPEVARVLLGSANANWLAGFATVEDGYHRTVHLEGFDAESVIAGERRLLALSHEMLPRLPVDDIDVLIVDELGKEISGAGMDTNIIGRLWIDGEPEPERPRVGALVVLDVTAASHGNAVGIGLADFTVRRLVDKIDFEITTRNTFTSGFLRRGRIPPVFATDAEAIDAALTHVFRAQPERRFEARVMRIRNTLELERLWVSPNLVAEARGLVSAGEPEPLRFVAGNLF